MQWIHETALTQQLNQRMELAVTCNEL